MTSSSVTINPAQELANAISSAPSSQGNGATALVPNATPLETTIEIQQKDPKEEHQAIVLREINRALDEYLHAERPVYLERLGIVYPVLGKEQQIVLREHHAEAHDEELISARFEKCGELVSMHRERFAHIVEIKELIELLTPRLPRDLTLAFNPRALRRFVLSVISSLREKLVTQGFLYDLTAIGTLYALHNRQGNDSNSWFAGSDIFLIPSLRIVRTRKTKYCVQRPVLDSAWEIFEALYGKPLRKFTVSAKKVLQNVGFAIDDIPLEPFRFAAFKKPLSHDQNSYIFVSEGLREEGLRSSFSRGFGNELVFQIDQHAVEALGLDPLDIPISPAELPLSLAALLVLSNKACSLRPGAALSCEGGLFPREVFGERAKTGLTAVVLTPVLGLQNEQLSSTGPFFFINVTGITNDEALLVTDKKVDLLLTFLAHKNSLQVTNPMRSSVLKKSVFSATKG